ncbi:MAG: branched-chain amino acid ABC transporter permease [Anaerolineae bacterium]|nr:branched-chain amino acid ABC transporter permease [Anaerolineae bacterium]NIN97394.1 branched-chain amino acid ABC transporter permease [Anaerolineae bacterium]NIQ80323.1 branched-chain amino acid ABC transporter permease [Anaerolineae bacterium]
MLKGIIGRKWLWAVTAILAIFLIVPLLAPRYYVYVLAVILVTALLAMSLNLTIGYGGLFQFHHGVFYGVGAYTVALVLTKTSMPKWVGFAAGPIAAALVGLLIGWFCIRLSQLYFGMLQISLGSLIWAIVYRWYDFTGGDDGIYGIPTPSILRSQNNSYYFILLVATICIIVMYVIVRSPFGATLQAIRDNPQRCAAVGINVRRHQLMAIVIATLFAGVAGVLFVTLERYVHPHLLFWVLSLEIFIMCLLGGWFTFAGPMLGAAIIVSLRTGVILTALISFLPDGEMATALRGFLRVYTEYWTLILGIVLILLIFFLPEGVMGFFQDRLRPRAAQGTEKDSG